MLIKRIMVAGSKQGNRVMEWNREWENEKWEQCKELEEEAS